jgi:hypothetical protein
MKGSLSRPLLPTRPQRHTNSHCLLMQGSYAPLELARDHRRLRLLTRERLQHADMPIPVAPLDPTRRG